MNFRRSIALFSSLLLCISATAHAGQYAATELGKALPMWMETLADINDDGDVAWTGWGGGHGQNTPANATSGQYHLDGVDAGPLTDASASSWAVGITERVRDGDFHVVGIAGSRAGSHKLLDRSAILWSLAWLENDSSQITELDLGALTAPETGSRESVQQSAAYGIVARSGSANTYYVGGFARDRVGSSTLPKPVIWSVAGARGDNPTIDAHRLATLGGAAGNGNGYVSSIAKNGNTYWACGNSSGASGAYVQATCWDISGGPSDDLAADATITNALTTAYGAGNVATSMVNRVRVLPIGSGGANHTVAIGSALVDGKWIGWAYDLNTGGFWDNLNIGTNAETLAYDAAAIQYAEEGGGTPSYGLMMGGVSRSAEGTSNDILNGAPVTVNTGVLRGVERRMLLNGTTDTGKVCMINDDSTTQAAQYDQLLALSSEGRYRLAMAGGQLVRLNAVDVPEVELKVNQRQYTRKTRTKGDTETIAYFYALADIDKEEAILRVSDTLGCDAPVFAHDNCSTDDPVAFDIADEDEDVVLGNVNNALRSAQVNKVFPASRNFVQLALRTGNSCTITPVKATVATELNPAKDHEDDTTSWAQCGQNSFAGYNTDIKNDVRHCGTCNNSVQELTCADNVCNDGTPAIGTVNANMCAIGSNNNWACYASDQQKPIPNTGAEVATNHCQQCKPALNQTQWATTTGTTCCDANAEPNITGWHNGYRPNGNNISYSGNTLQSNWVRRIQEVSDGGFWEVRWGPLCQGPICYDRGRPNKRDRVQRLTSYLSEADAEDWYVFSHLDENDHGEKVSYPRIRVKPKHNQQVKLCAYPRCLDNLAQAQRNAWAEGLLNLSNNKRRTRGLDGVGIEIVTAENSPLKEDGVGLRGVCITTQGNQGAADLAFIVEDYNNNEGNSHACWNMDWFVQVESANAPSALSCDNEHELYWGNWVGDNRGWHTCGQSWDSPDIMEGRNHSMCDGNTATKFNNP